MGHCTVHKLIVVSLDQSLLADHMCRSLVYLSLTCTILKTRPALRFYVRGIPICSLLFQDWGHWISKNGLVTARWQARDVPLLLFLVIME